MQALPVGNPIAPFALVDVPCQVSTQIFPWRAHIPPQLIDKSILFLKQGAVLEKIQFFSQPYPLVRLVQPGQFLFSPPLINAIGACASEAQAIHMHGTLIQVWDSGAFLQGDAARDTQILQWYGQTLSACCKRMSELLHYSAGYRLASLLLDLACCFGIDRSDGYVFLPLRLGIRDLAECIGSTRETASNSLNRLKRNRIVHTEGGLWLIATDALVNYQERL